MREIVVGKTKRMSWKVGISLIMTFTLLSGSLVCLGWILPNPAEAAPTANGRVIYSNGTNTTPQSRAYTASSNTFGAAGATVAGAAQSSMVERACPTRNEHIAGYVTTGGVLYILRWNGTSWSGEWNVTVGGNGVDGRRFDIAYEKTSGKGVVVYSTNTTTSGGAKLAYRTWNGTSWSAATTVNTARSSQVAAITSIKMKANPKSGSNEIAVLACDNGTTAGNNALLTALIWNGSGWTEAGSAFTGATQGYIPSTTGQLVQNDLFDLAYETLSGDLLVVYTTSTPQQYYRTYSGGTWGTPTSYATGRAAPLQMVAESDPQSDKVLVMWNRSASANVYGNVWTGTAVGTTTTVGATNTTTEAIQKKHITAKWLMYGTTSYGVAVWNSATAGTFGYAVFNGGTSAWAAATTYVSGTGVAANWMDSDVDPFGPDTMMMTFTTGTTANSVSLRAKRAQMTGAGTVTWTNAEGAAALATTLANATTQNFAFAYDRLDVVAPTVSTFTVTSPSSSLNVPVTAFTATDNIGVTGYLITTTNLPKPGAGDPGWSGTGTFTAASDGTYTLYPWAKDAAGNVSAEFATPRTVTVDTTPPSVTVNQAAGQVDPANSSPVNFTVVFSESVTGFNNADVTIGGTAGGTKTAVVTGSGATYNVAVSGMTTSGTVTVGVIAGAAADPAGNASTASTSTDNTVTWDIAPVTVTINQAAGQADPTDVSPVNFTVVFSEPVSNFTSGDVTLGGASGATTATVTGSGTSYNVAVSGMTGSGAILPSIAAGAVTDPIGNPNTASTSADNTVTWDVTPPAGLSPTSPSDESTDQLLDVALQSTTASDPSGGVTYRFDIWDGETYSANSGWIAGTSYGPPGLTYGTTYTWTVRAKDVLGNEVVSTPRTFTTAGACVRNEPTLTLLTPSGGIASTITADGGTAVYNLKIINNDYGGCGSTQFNFSVSDTDLNNIFDDPALGVTSVTLTPGAQTTTTVTVRATPGEVSGGGRTRASSAADAYHASVTTGDVQTTLNVVACTAKTPLLIVGPDSGYVNRGGTFKYTITVKNTDTGTGCPSVDYNLSIPSETNTADFTASQLSTGILHLSAGQLGSATLTVFAKAAAAKNQVNSTTVRAVAAGHSTPPNKAVTTTVSNPMIHNSDSTGSTKWGADGGWGIPSARYGEFDCTTCHVPGGTDTGNIKRIRESVTTPDPAKGQIPGAGQPVTYTRNTGTSSAQSVLGWDLGATPRSKSSKICEVCHTHDSTGARGVKYHPYSSTSALGNHFNTDGKDCIKCHKHNRGFGIAGLSCTGCHGTPTDTITPDNRYVVAPPVNSSGDTGSITGIGQVSNDSKVGAHQAHLRNLNGFTNYSTFDFRCQNCHGALPTDFSHINGNSTPQFQGLATRSGMSPTFNNGNVSCSNTYCHNPAGSGVLLAANAGSNVFPTWTSASYVSSGTKSVSNCSVCHKVPGVSGFEPAGTHSGMNTNTEDCSGCHGHNGNTGGIVGRRHMDGIKFGAGNCDTCHGYDVGTWAAKAERSGVAEGKGAHEKHITYLKTRYNIVALAPASDRFGGVTSSWTNVCGVCHNNATHEMGEAIPGTGRSISIIPARAFGAAPVYNGSPGVSSQVRPKTCSNVDCHYKETPVWSSY
jgi:hypothetical protein